MTASDDSALRRAGGVLTIDLDALSANYRMLAQRAAPAECAAAVKADAYGVGVDQATKALAKAGCKTFLVVLLDEAARVRAAVPEATIYVMGGLFPGSAPDFLGLGVRPVLDSLEEIAEWSDFALGREKRLPAAIHIDTGMNRLGLGAVELARLTADQSLLEGIDISLIMSHLACANNPANPFNEQQRARFTDALAGLPRAPASLANSGGVFLGKPFHFDMVRPGIALYGGNPMNTTPNLMRPVIHLDGLIAQVRDVAKGESVGYGATYRFERPSRLATVAVGYADGYFRALSRETGGDGAEAVLGGRRVPVVGRVSMDSIALDVTGCDPAIARRGARVQLIGDTITIDEIATKAGTIGYEVLTSLGSRFARVYAGATS